MAEMKNGTILIQLTAPNGTTRSVQYEVEAAKCGFLFDARKDRAWQASVYDSMTISQMEADPAAAKALGWEKGAEGGWAKVGAGQEA
jgi:hypothetical protein